MKLKILKKQIGRRSIIDTSTRNDSKPDDSNNLEESDDAKESNDEESNNNDDTNNKIEQRDIESSETFENNNNESSFSSPKRNQNMLGESLSEIQGTPIVETSGSINKLPDIDKFSDGICAHKAYEMDAQTPVGSYKNIVKLTREFKSETNINQK